MNLRRFVLIDALALDAAGVVALLLGEVAIGVSLFVLASLALVAYGVMRRRAPAPA